MNSRQAYVVQALQRVYDNVVVLESEPGDDFIYVIMLNDGIAVMSILIPDRQNPDQPDVGDSVYFEYNKRMSYGLIVIYRDMDESIGIVPDGARELVWEHIRNVEIIASRNDGD